MKKLNKILLIDDDIAINFLHQIVIKTVDCTDTVVIKKNGKEGLDYLKEKQDGNYPNPEIIFLDINMPVMDGWGFLEEYNNLTSEQKAKSLVVMLSTSLNPDDTEKSEAMGIKRFIHKPLTAETLQDIIKEYRAMESE